MVDKSKVKGKGGKAAKASSGEGFVPTQEQIDRVVNRKEVQPNWKAFSDFIAENGGPRIKPEHVGIVLTGYNPLFQKTDLAKQARQERGAAAAERKAEREAAREQREKDRAAKKAEAAEKKAAREQAAKDKAAKKTTTSAAKASKPTPKASAGKAAAKKSPAKKKAAKKAAF